MEVRCSSRVHFMLDDGIAIVKCQSKKCGNQSGVNVFHHIDISTGRVLKTVRFKEPKALFRNKEATALCR